MIIPLINRQQLFIGKFLANYLFTIGIAVIQYAFMYLFGFSYYGPIFIDTPLISFMLVLLYLLTLNTLISLLSSFMTSEAYVIIITLALYFFGFSMIESLVHTINPNIEPLFSLNYLYNIIVQIINPDLSFSGGFTEDPETGIIEWLFPSVGSAIFSLSIQAIIFFIVTLYILKKKQI